MAGEAGSTITLTLGGTNALIVLPPVPATGGPQAVTLSPQQVASLGNGTVSVSAVASDAAGNQSEETRVQFTIDTVAPAVPTLALGAGVVDGATAIEATQSGGAVTVVGEVGAEIGVEFVGPSGPVTKALTGNGFPQPVQLTLADLAELGDGPITVSARQTDQAGNPQLAGPAIAIFVLDTVAPAISAFRSGSPNGTYDIGEAIVIEAVLSEPVRPGGSIVAGLNTGRSVTMTLGADGVLRGSYTVQPNDIAADLDVVTISSPQLVDLAGNIAGSLSLPAVGLADVADLVVDGRVRLVPPDGFGTDPAAAPSRTTAVTVIPINLSTPVTGLSIDKISLFFNSTREISLGGAVLTGSGANYTLVLPSILTNLRGSYEFRIDTSGITADVNGSELVGPLSLYWNKIA